MAVRDGESKSSDIIDTTYTIKSVEASGQSINGLENSDGKEKQEGENIIDGYFMKKFYEKYGNPLNNLSNDEIQIIFNSLRYTKFNDSFGLSEDIFKRLGTEIQSKKYVTLARKKDGINYILTEKKNNINASCTCIYTKGRYNRIIVDKDTILVVQYLYTDSHIDSCTVDIPRNFRGTFKCNNRTASSDILRDEYYDDKDTLYEAKLFSRYSEFAIDAWGGYIDSKALKRGRVNKHQINPIIVKAIKGDISEIIPPQILDIYRIYYPRIAEEIEEYSKKRANKYNNGRNTLQENDDKREGKADKGMEEPNKPCRSDEWDGESL